jgi:hypothetical protein
MSEKEGACWQKKCETRQVCLNNFRSDKNKLNDKA